VRRFLSAAVAIVALISLGEPVIRADIIGTFDEFGNGTSVNSSTGEQNTITGQSAVDPFDPTNGLMPLVYLIGTNLSMVNGDIVLLDPGTGEVSDLFRFFTTMVDPQNSQNWLIFYSQIESPPIPGALADVGIPSSRQATLLTLTEQGPPEGPRGLFDYMPTTGQPGFAPLPAPFGNLVYNIISFGQPSVVPEPGSVVLLATGLTAVLGTRRLRRRRFD
jgi:hypothetical protein